MSDSDIKIGLISFYFNEAFFSPLSNLIQIFASISKNCNVVIAIDENMIDKLPVITDVKYVLVKQKKYSFLLFQVINYILLDFRLCYKILKISKNIDVFVFFNESPRLFTFILIKILKKRIFWLLPSSFQKMAMINMHPIYFFPLIIYSIGLRISDRIILYTQNLIDDWKLNKYEYKISIAHRHVIDNVLFFPMVPLQGRKNIIGYVGRLSNEKGILNLINAFQILRNKNFEVKMTIIGDGPLHSKIIKFIETNNFQDTIFVKSWVPHSDLPRYYNQFKILVLPSFTEGLPNVVLEAMACGTPVLCNRVGAIPDIIENEKNGFLLTNNSPDTIADAIYNIITLKDLNNITINARAKIVNDFSEIAAENLWEKILSENNAVI